jgi:voltage-gated potassium channel
MFKIVSKLHQKMDECATYQKSRAFFFSLFHDIHSPYKKYFDAFMITLIVSSIAILILGKHEKIPEWFVKFDLYVVTTIFALEYLLRLWVSEVPKAIDYKQNSQEKRTYLVLKSKIKYIFSLPALIDFLAIFPKFRIIRLLKLYHYMHGTSSLFNTLLKKRFEFTFLGYMVFAITFTMGTIFYLLEYGVNEQIGSYLDAIYWALITISTVGYGDISPVTDIGKVVSMFGIIFGIAMISFVTSVMVSAFSERFDELRNQNSIKLISKLSDVVIINGYGYLGATIASKLKHSTHYQPVIIEKDEEKFQKAIEDGYSVIRSDGSSAKIVKDLYKTDNIIAMLTLTSSDILNIYFTLNAKSINREICVFSRINDPKLKPQYEATKLDGMVEPYEVANKKTYTYLTKLLKDRPSKISFVGFTHKSKHLISMLMHKNIDITIYETDENRSNEAKEFGLKYIEPLNIYSNYDKLLNENIVVCALEDEELNVYTAITLKSKEFKGSIIALSDSKEDNRKLLLAGADKIFDMYEESANHFIEMIENRVNT